MEVQSEITYQGSILKRRLTVTHLSLVRGWVQGLDLSDLSKRYLAGIGGDDGHVDLRVAKTTLMQVLDDLAMWAHRAGMAGGIALRRQASRIRVSTEAPSLEDFAVSLNAPDFYREDELAAMYAEQYDKTADLNIKSQARRARLVGRQMELIAKLADHVVAPMALNDKLEAWFDDAISLRLEKLGLNTILDVTKAIAQDKTGWFEGIKGIGASKAERIHRFLVAQRGPIEDSLASAGIRPAARIPTITDENRFRAILTTVALPAPHGILAVENATEIPLTTASHPMSVSQLDGSQGRLRGPAGKAATKAINDLDALNTWLGTKTAKSTKILYRREIERLMMWCTREKQLALSSLSIEDVMDYRAFLAKVPPEWICKKGTTLNADGWSPFAGSLSSNSIRKSLVIAHGFYSWLVNQGYCTANPFYGVKAEVVQPPSSEASTSAEDNTSLEFARELKGSFVEHTLSYVAIQAVERELQEAEQGEYIARARFIFRFAVKTGLRISELAAARRGQLKRIEPTALDEGGWELAVVGKRSKLRDVPIPDSFIQDLTEYFENRGIIQSLAQVEPGVFLVGKLSTRLKHGTAITKGDQPGDGVRPQTIHRILGELFRRAAERVGVNDEEAKKKLLKASTHWLRHTCATDAVASEVPLDVVASTLGHASLVTTSLYVHAEGRRKIKEMKKYWARDVQS
jgi:integrase